MASSYGMAMNLMKSPCQPVLKTIYLPDCLSRNHAGAKVILRSSKTVLVYVCAEKAKRGSVHAYN